MSRYYDDYDDEAFPGESDLWRANYRRALKGKRGRKALADLREALLALPERKLISRALCTVNRNELRSSYYLTPGGVPEHEYLEQEGIELGGVCAVGAYVWHQKVKSGMDPTEAFESLPTLDDTNHDIWETQQVGIAAGLTQHVAWKFAFENDETFEECTPEQRWQRFMDWIDKQLAEVSA